MENKRNKGNKRAWFWIVVVTLLIIGNVLIAVGGVFKDSIGIWSTILISLGTSIDATAITSIYFKILDEHTDKDIEEKFNKIHELMLNSSPEKRVVFSRHLRNVFDDLLNKYKFKDNIEINIIGLELYHFFDDQFEKIKRYKNIKLRLIVQNPCSDSFKDMIDVEARNYKTVFENITSLTERIDDYNKKGSSKNKIEIKWLSYPSSITITQVQDIMYVRPRFLKEGEGDDDIFFEKYNNTERNFKAYSVFFSNAWTIAADPYAYNNKLLNDAKTELKRIKENGKS